MAANQGTLLLTLLRILPRRLISRFAGTLAAVPWPGPMQRALLRWFAARYAVNTAEAEFPLEHYRSLNAFFTRRLKPGSRTIAGGAGLFVSPVDAVISQVGLAEHGRLIQAKGMDYGVDELLAGADSARFRDGAYAVLYLSPPDYHRIHTPCEGAVVAWQYNPGTLFPVNQAAVHGIEGLFPKNERLTSYIQTERHGLVAVVKVGATNVGRIRVVYDAFRTNRAFQTRGFHAELPEPVALERGAELGMFEMGSTVILLFEAGRAAFDEHVAAGQRVSVGERLGRFV